MRKITAYPVLIVLFSCLLFSGCIKIEPTYTKEKAAESIVALCEKEYRITAKAWLVGDTVWIYLPLPRLFKKDLNWDKKQLEKINKVMLSASRVMLSMRPRAQFMALVSSDTKEYGLDYIIMTCVQDILKLHNQYISREEFLRRNVIMLENKHSALGDSEGAHVEKKDLSLEYFVSEQLTQRIQQHFMNEPRLKDKFKVNSVSSKFQGDILKVSYYIQPKDEKSTVDVLKEIKKLTADVSSAYEIKSFLVAKIVNLVTKDEVLVSKVELRELLK
jgi:hypothetical protein